MTVWPDGHSDRGQHRQRQRGPGVSLGLQIVVDHASSLARKLFPPSPFVERHDARTTGQEAERQGQIVEALRRLVPETKSNTGPVKRGIDTNQSHVPTNRLESSLMRSIRLRNPR